MRLALLSLFGTLSFLANVKGSTVVCSDDQPDVCECKFRNTSLIIECEYSRRLHSTNIAVPDNLINNVSSVSIKFNNIDEITQITNPLLSKQLANLLVELEISEIKLKKIDPKVFDGLPKLQTLKLLKNGLDDKLISKTWLTSTLGKTLLGLDLSGNSLKMISKGVFDNLVNMKELVISENGIENISDLNLDNLPQLSNLNLEYNNIHQITSDSFGNLNHLTYLNLNLNWGVQISTGSFKALSNLSSIDLEFCRLTKIPDASAFAQPIKLATLNLYGNKITQIAESGFSGATNLKVIQLKSNKIKKLPIGGFKSLKNVDQLDLSQNLIENISFGSLNGLDSVTSISLSENNIQKIDDGSFDALHELKTLDFSKNGKIGFTDKTFGSNGLINLTFLSLSRCYLKSLSDGLLKNLPRLEVLNLEENFLTSVPTALRSTKSLQKLLLTLNNITRIDGNAFGSNPSLREISLGAISELSVINDCSFCGLTGLRTLYLIFNDNLKQINENAFGFLKNSVDKTGQISDIEIHDGGLKTVPFKLLPWDQMKISILGTPANCDARMDWLFRNKDYRIDMTPTGRYYNKQWCEKCRHDRVCQKMYGWDDPTTISPVKSKHANKK